MLQKRLLHVLLIILVTFMLQACNHYEDAGIIKWSVQDNVLDWKDVKGAAYYKIDFYRDVEETNVDLTNTSMYVYESEYSMYRFQNDSTLNLVINVFYEDGTKEESDMFSFTIHREFQYPYSVGGNYIPTDLTWHDCSNFPGFKDYTLKIDDEEFSVNTNEYDLSNYDSGIYKIQVKANYEEGSSDWSYIYYYYLPLTTDTEHINVNFDLKLDETFTYTFSEDISIQVVQGYNGYSLFGVLPDSIVTIDGLTLTFNKYYIQNEITFEQNAHYSSSESGILLAFRILTDDTVYNIYLMNSDS